MRRRPKPRWREERQAYFATVNGVCQRLGTSLREAHQELKKLPATSKSHRRDGPMRKHWLRYERG